MIWRTGSKTQVFSVYQATTIIQKLTMMRVWLFTLLKMCTDTIKSSKHYLLKTTCNMWHHVAILSKSQRSLELVSSLQDRAKNMLEMFVKGCTIV